jgi:uncharacterized membrane protein
MDKRSIIPVAFWKTISISVLIIVLCLIPASELNKLNVKVDFGDMVVHFFMFLTFSAALFFDLIKYSAGRSIKFSPFIISLSISVSFGISTETLQYLLTFLNRSGDFIDLLFDFFGSLAGIGIVRFIKRKSDAGF